MYSSIISFIVMRISFKLLDNNQEISDKILQALIPEIDKYLKKSLQTIRKKLPILIINVLKNTPEYDSLSGGQLQYEFGIPDSTNKLNSNLEIWSKNIDIVYKSPTITGNRIKASFSVSLIRNDFSDVLSSDASFVFDNLKGYQLPWLEWLLLEGNKIIVPKQEVILGPNKFSRTGYAIMRESNKSWKVPSQFAGTKTDNWITRAIDNAESQINELLDKAFEK